MPHALLIREKKAKAGKVYYPLQLHLVAQPTPGPNELLVKMQAAALNHRDLFIRQNLYPDVSFQSPLLSDGCGTVVDAGPGCSAASRRLVGQLVVLTPSRGWQSSPEGPEVEVKVDDIGGGGGGTDTDTVAHTTFGAIGGVSLSGDHHLGSGTAQTYAVVHETEVEPSPPHLSAVEAAALPTCGLTGWRALVTKCGLDLDSNSNANTTTTTTTKNILVTGIGGGVALQVLQFAVALGCSAWVTSGSEAKLERARRLGARGGVLYTRGEWHKDLAALLRTQSPGRPYLDAVVDGAGGDIVVRATGLLRPGGVVSCYGMTLAPVLDWPMQAVLKNLELRGSTLGSRDEFRAMVAFVAAHGIRPVISRTVKGLDCVDAVDGLFDVLRAGTQFGKLVIEF